MQEKKINVKQKEIKKVNVREEGTGYKGSTCRTWKAEDPKPMKVEDVLEWVRKVELPKLKKTVHSHKPFVAVFRLMGKEL